MWDNFIGTTSSILVLKKVMLAINAFDESMPALQDYDLYIRICKDHKVKGVDKALVSYLYNHSNQQISMKKDDFQKACILLGEKYQDWEYSSILIIGLAKLRVKRIMHKIYE